MMSIPGLFENPRDLTRDYPGLPNPRCLRWRRGLLEVCCGLCFRYPRSCTACDLTRLWTAAKMAALAHPAYESAVFPRCPDMLVVLNSRSQFLAVCRTYPDHPAEESCCQGHFLAPAVPPGLHDEISSVATMCPFILSESLGVFLATDCHLLPSIEAATDATSKRPFLRVRP